MFEDGSVASYRRIMHGDTVASKPMANSPLGADVIAGIPYGRYALAMTALKVARKAPAASCGPQEQWMPLAT